MSTETGEGDDVSCVGLRKSCKVLQQVTQPSALKLSEVLYRFGARPHVRGVFAAESCDGVEW